MAKKGSYIQHLDRYYYNERTGRSGHISGIVTRGAGSGRGSSLRLTNVTRQVLKGSVVNKYTWSNPKRAVKKGMKG